ncbi:hypothetical protein HMI55_000629, partial [Coelomomyces lativittatus]
IPGYAFYKLSQMLFPGTSILSSLTKYLRMDTPLNIEDDGNDLKAKKATKVKRPKMKFVRG